MAIAHALPGQVIDVQPLGGELSKAHTVALFKSEDLEVMRLVLQAGRAMPPHRVPGEITLQCMEGVLHVSIDGESCELRAGQLMYLSGGTMHGVLAKEDASALLTVVLSSASPASRL